MWPVTVDAHWQFTQAEGWALSKSRCGAVPHSIGRGHRNLPFRAHFQVFLIHASRRRASPPEPGRALGNIRNDAGCMGASRLTPPGASEFMGHAPLADVDPSTEIRQMYTLLHLTGTHGRL